MYLIITFLALLCVVQIPPSKVGGTLKGAVVNAITNAPVSGARVVLVSMDSDKGEMSTRTEADGKFLFAHVTAGKYTLHATANKFVATTYGDGVHPVPGTLLSLADGQQIGKILLRMTPTGVITGNVTDENGNPMIGVQVTAIPPGRRARKPLSPEDGGKTDDRGEYRLYDLAPGNYYLIATPESPEDTIQPRNHGVRQEEAYPPTFYPGVTSLNQAVAVSVRPSQETPADFVVTPARTVHVRGSVKDMTGKPITGAIFLNSLEIGGSVFAGASEVKDGNFDVGHIFPGRYAVNVMSPNPSDPETPLSAEQEITVTNDGLNGLSLIVAPPGNISGTVHVDGNRRIDLSTLSISVLPKQADVMEQGSFTFSSEVTGFGFGQVKQDGTFHIKSLRSGREYQVLVAAQKHGWEDWYTKSITIGNRDVSNSGFTLLPGGELTLSVLVSPDGASFQGTVRSSQGEVVPGAMVIAVPEGSLAERRDLFESGTTDQYGRFRLRGFAPGQYRLYAFQNADREDWSDSDFLRKYEQLSKEVSIAEGEVSRVDLQVIAGEAAP